MAKVVSILVVDDDESMLEYCTYILAVYGFEVTPAATGNQVLEQLKSKIFDVVLTDHVTVDARGTSVIKAVKATQPGAEIIVMSGIPTLENAAASYLAGARAYLAKPFSLEQLRTAVLKCLDSKAPVR